MTKQTTTKDNSYTCERCGKTYEKAWSDKEAQDEYEQNFPEAVGFIQSIVCDDCYKEFIEWHRSRDARKD